MATSDQIYGLQEIPVSSRALYCEVTCDWDVAGLNRL